MDYAEALEAARTWLGKLVVVLVQPAGGRVAVVHAIGVVADPELLEDPRSPDGETWMFPLGGEGAAFLLPAATFVDATWKDGGSRLVLELEDVELEISAP